MRAIGPSVVVFATLLAADPRAEILDVLNVLASGLSSGNAAAFLKPFDPKMPGYGDLRSNVHALLAVSEVGASIEILTEEGDGQKRTVQLDWFLELRGKQPGATTQRRRQTVTCRFERHAKSWKVTSLQPPGFFAP